MCELSVPSTIICRLERVYRDRLPANYVIVRREPMGFPSRSRLPASDGLPGRAGCGHDEPYLPQLVRNGTGRLPVEEALSAGL